MTHIIESKWTHILSPSELEARYALTYRLDPRFARSERAFWESRTPDQLKVLADQSWVCNEPDAYQIARSLLTLKGEVAS